MATDNYQSTHWIGALRFMLWVKMNTILMSVCRLVKRIHRKFSVFGYKIGADHLKNIFRAW